MVFEKNLIKLLAGTFFGLLLVACEQPAGDSEGGSQPDEDKKPNLISATLAPFYTGATTSYIRVSTNCRGYSVLEITYQSTLTTKNTIWKTCAGNMAVQNLPISQGTTAQLVSVKVVGYMEQPSKPLNFPYNLTVNFNPATPSTNVAGKGISSGGGPISGTGITIVNNSIGEVFSGTSTATGVNVRNGIQGTIDP